MRRAYAAVLVVMTVSPAFAQREPQIVIPGRPDVPVIINGVDASWGVVEGEFGLDRPGLVAPTVIYRPLLLPASVPESGPGYFPRTGRKPGYGRLEIAPPPGAPKPPPAPSYYRSWSSQSGSAPPTFYQQYDVPPVVVEPRSSRYGNGSNRRSSPKGMGQGRH
jgi:hypothetical protein